MARYQYAGPGPVPDPESGEIVHPGDVREFGEAPDWGPWECLDPAPEEEAVTPESAPPVSAVLPGVPVMQFAPVAPSKLGGM